MNNQPCHEVVAVAFLCGTIGGILMHVLVLYLQANL